MRTSLVAVCLGLVLAGCSDNGPVVDKGPTPDTAAADKGPAPEKGVSDKSPVPDKPVIVDKSVKDTGVKTDGLPKVNGPTHTGWQKTSCTGTGCHPATIPNHTATKGPECAKCHGGNGACNPDGKNSLKQNHNSTSTCTMCHGSKHGYSATADCAACHFATSGVIDCP